MAEAMVGGGFLGLGGHAESKTALGSSAVEIQELSVQCDIIDYAVHLFLSLLPIDLLTLSLFSSLCFLVTQTFIVLFNILMAPTRERRSFHSSS